ncbi:bile acid:sodium symporter family protein [Dactylosporangium sp. NPDC005555]|uniref:bile acid:sodium symporter family protein n=1 Tax=Dactylosporangium sp. NPDC005555 TaxID=3154889 RepID=UPI0033ABD241
MVDRPECTVGSTLISASLPVALFVVMLGLGLSLTVEDFRRVGRHSRAVVIALVCQLVLLPVICFGLVLAFGLPAALAVGMMLVAASPGGPTANLYSHLFGGHVALNVTLTAVNTALIVVTLPIVVNLSAAYFLPDGAALGLQFGKVFQVFLMVLVPVAIGMLVRARVPGVADRLNRPVRVLSVVVLVAVISLVVYAERANIADHVVAVGAAAVTFNVISLLIGYGAPRLAGVEHRAAIASGFEIGVHNTTIAVTVALSPALLNNAEMAIPGAVYGILMHFAAFGFGFLLTRRRVLQAVSGGPAAVEPG